MMKKKLLFTIASTMLVFPLITGCGEEATSTDGEVQGDLVIWEHDPSFEESVQTLVDEFNKEYPDVNIEVEAKSGSDCYSLLTTSLQSGSGPDLFWTNGTATENMQTFVEQEKVADISEIVDLSELSEESYDLAKIDDKTYSVPWMTFDARAVYYNKDIFKELGITEPKTFDEFEAMLAKIKDNGYVPISLSGLSSWQLLWVYEVLLASQYPEYTKGFDDYSVKADSEEARAALDKVVEWAEKGYFGDGFKGVDSNGQTLAFTTGKAAMTIDGSWMVQTIEKNNPDLNFGAFQIPSNDGTKTMMGSFANGFSMNADTENSAAAEAFLQFCATKEAQEIWVKELHAVSGDSEIPSAEGVAQEISNADQVVGTWQSMLTKHSSGSNSAASVWEEEGTAIFGDKLTVDELMDKIGAAMD